MSALGSQMRDEFHESRQLLLDEVARGFILQLAGLLVDLRSAAADENLRLVEHEGVQKHHRLAQIVLHPRTAHRTGRCRLSAIGLPAKGWLGSRETQSMAFLRPPGIEKLYSGVTMITPSAARMASASAVTGPGNPVAP